MAIYRCEARIIGRDKIGHSVVAAAAYRSGSKLWDERQGKTQNYSRRSKGVIESTILSPKESPAWVFNPELLWNRVEAGEKRKDAQLAREFILAVPPELSATEQFQLAVAWAQQELVASGMVAEVSLHHSKTGKNPHVHILCTMRKLDGNKFSAKKPREWNDVGVLFEQRESWANAVNAALEKAGRPERVDHRSLKDQGIDRIPQPKIGKEAMGMKKRGIVADPERFQLVRWVKSLNAVRPWARAIEKSGEVHQRGMGNTWWERSLLFMSQTRQAVRETVMDTWRSLLNARLPGRQDIQHDIPPQMDKGPDRSR
jgi:ATP-dependent exoDNAse (exonuclease V) alpha subunit